MNSYEELVKACRDLLMARYNNNNQEKLDEAFWAMRQIMWPDNGKPSLDQHLEPPFEDIND